ncbi:MAG: DUF624 domain-containing protein [Clostridia bacterium]|nr:DUF624 domain-containing protein [Clostridia bacterium]
MKTTKKSRLNLYDWFYKRDHKEDADDDRDAPRNFAFFFKLLFRNFSRVFTLNIYFALGGIGLWLLILLVSGIVGPHSSAPTSDLFAPLYGAAAFVEDPSPILNVLLSVHAQVTEIAVMTPLMITLIVIAVVLLALTFGPVTVGITYNMRNIVRGEPLFLWEDFWHAIKTNLRQSILLGIVDLAILAALVYGVVFYYLNLGGAQVFGTFFLFTLVLIVFYLMMRKYLYTMLVTFELSLFKLFKNALIFAILGLGRNIVSLVGCLFVIFLNWMLFSAFMPLGVIMPFMITIGLCIFIEVYIAWPKIHATMIAPYLDENGNYIEET